MSDWIEVNLPWDADMPDLPKKLVRKFKGTDAETRKVHGMTIDEALAAYEALGRKDEYVWKLQDAMEPEFVRLGIQEGLEHREERWRLTHERWRKRKGQKAVADAWYKWKVIILWEDDHPKSRAREDFYEKWVAENTPKSFTGSKLNKPGTWIKTAEGKTYLIGHINRNRGVCDDCTAFESNAVIVAYKPPAEEIPEP